MTIRHGGSRIQPKSRWLLAEKASLLQAASAQRGQHPGASSTPWRPWARGGPGRRKASWSKIGPAPVAVRSPQAQSDGRSPSETTFPTSYAATRPSTPRTAVEPMVAVSAYRIAHTAYRTSPQGSRVEGGVGPRRSPTSQGPAPRDHCLSANVRSVVGADTRRR